MSLELKRRDVVLKMKMKMKMVGMIKGFFLRVRSKVKDMAP